MTTSHRRALGAGIAAAAVAALVTSTPALAAEGRTPQPRQPQPADGAAAVVQRLPRPPRGHRTRRCRRSTTRRRRRSAVPSTSRRSSPSCVTRWATARSLTVAAGDLIGGSTFLSGLFHDEPSVESLNAMGLDVSSVGNHEFDEGTEELLRMQYGGCHPVDGCYFPDAALRRGGLPVARRQRRQEVRRRDAAARDLGQERRRRQGRLHRDDPRGHRPARQPRRGVERRRSRTRSRPPTPPRPAEAAGCQGDRRSHARGWPEQRHVQLSASGSPSPSRRWRPSSARRSTRSSPGTPTTPTSARSPTLRVTRAYVTLGRRLRPSGHRVDR